MKCPNCGYEQPYTNTCDGRRYVILPKDGQIYYIEEGTDEKWIGNKPVKFIGNEGYYCGWGIANICFKFSDIGKTVFLTKPEAEQALKGGAK